jgi:hypothetical protein
MANFLRHTSCPSCGSRDNLARYDDGSAFCFGCHFTERGTESAFVRDRRRSLIQDEEVPTISLPKDAETNLPGCVVKYLSTYGISVREALGIGVLSSPYKRQLIYPYYTDNGDGTRTLACYQARNFDQQASGPKYFNKGKTTDIVPIIHCSIGSSANGAAGKRYNGRLVITEDALSALKVARQCDAMPALGTNVPVKKLQIISRTYTRLTVWLDSDKWREARHIADNFKWLGLSADTIFTEKDPKEYSDDEIKGYLK